MSVVLAIVGVLFANGGADRIVPQVAQQLVPSSCIVGLNGAAVSVQLDGPGASAACDQWATTTVTDGGTWYVYNEGTLPGGAVLCQVDWRDMGIVYTVRDQGLTNAYGTALCRNLLAVDLDPTLAVPDGGENVEDMAPFEFDPTSADSLSWQQHQYLYAFIKPCPRAGCEDASPDPRFAWMDDWEGPIPAEFQPCLIDPDGADCNRALMGL